MNDLIVNKLKSYNQFFNNNFPINMIINPMTIEHSNQLDDIFESVWNDLKPYFIPDLFFGYPTKSENNENKLSRKNFQLSSTYEIYIKNILKRHCIISSIELTKELYLSNEYVSLFQLSQHWKDIGFFAITKNYTHTKDDRKLEHLMLDANFPIHKQMTEKLTLNPTDDNLSTYTKRKLYQLNKQISISLNDNVTTSNVSNNIDKISLRRKLSKEGNRFNTRAKRFRNNGDINYTNSYIINWGTTDRPKVSFNNCNLAYTLIDSNISTFESSISKLTPLSGKEITKTEKSSILKCLDNHFSLGELFKDYDENFEFYDTNLNKNTIKYNELDIIILNHNLERFYHIDLLYELIHLRRIVINDANFTFDSTVYDDSLIDFCKIPVTYSRILFALYGINTRNNDTFLEKSNERELFVDLYSLKYKQATSKHIQQLIWSNKFSRYVEQLSSIYIPLLEKAFVGALYAKKLDNTTDTFQSYIPNLLSTLSNYAYENMPLFKIDATSDDTFEWYNKDYYKETNRDTYDKSYNNNDQFKKIKNKLKDFLKNDINSLTDDELKFIHKFYTTTFDAKNADNILNYDIIEKYKELTMLSITEPSKKSKVHSISENYRKEKASLDIKYLIDFLQTDS